MQAYDIDAQTARTVYATMLTVFPNIQTWFTNGGNTSVADNSDLGVNAPFNLTGPDFLLSGGSILASGAAFTEAELNDPFFDQVSFKGAFGSENWTSGWCNWDPQNTPY